MIRGIDIYIFRSMSRRNGIFCRQKKEENVSESQIMQKESAIKYRRSDISRRGSYGVTDSKSYEKIRREDGA